MDALELPRRAREARSSSLPLTAEHEAVVNSQPSKTAANPVGEIRLAALRAAPQPTGWSYLDSRTLTGRTRTREGRRERMTPARIPGERCGWHCEGAFARVIEDGTLPGAPLSPRRSTARRRALSQDTCPSPVPPLPAHRRSDPPTFRGTTARTMADSSHRPSVCPVHGCQKPLHRWLVLAKVIRSEAARRRQD